MGFIPQQGGTREVLFGCSLLIQKVFDFSGRCCSGSDRGWLAYPLCDRRHQFRSSERIRRARGQFGDGDGDERCPEASFVTASKRRTGRRCFQGFGFSGLERSAGACAAQERQSRLRGADVTLAQDCLRGRHAGVGNGALWAC